MAPEGPKVGSSVARPQGAMAGTAGSPQRTGCRHQHVPGLRAAAGAGGPGGPRSLSQAWDRLEQPQHDSCSHWRYWNHKVRSFLLPVSCPPHPPPPGTIATFPKPASHPSSWSLSQLLARDPEALLSPGLCPSPRFSGRGPDAPEVGHGPVTALGVTKVRWGLKGGAPWGADTSMLSSSCRHSSQVAACPPGSGSSPGPRQLAQALEAASSERVVAATGLWHSA